jgi:hypothetical protein
VDNVQTNTVIIFGTCIMKLMRSDIVILVKMSLVVFSVVMLCRFVRGY